MTEEKGSIKSILAIILIVGLFLSWIISGVRVLVAQNAPISLENQDMINLSEGDYVVGNVMISSIEYCEYTRCLDYIPLARHHFFLIFNKDQTQCITIRADKSWEDRFAQGLSIDPNGTQVKGCVCKLDDKVQDKLDGVMNALTEGGYSISTNKNIFIDCLAERLAWMKIITGGLMLLLTAFIGIILKIQPTLLQKKWITGTFFILLLVDILMIIYLCTVL